ncbi:MAG: response regulator [Anaerolineae bacterium]|nr:response regulator [Anaerolineae bacterium]
MKTKIPQVLQGWSVVVADDEEDSLIVATMLLEMAGADVRQARNGREALGLIRQSRPHFVLSDLSMPEMDGWLLMHELNTDRSTIDLPVIALTAHAMSGDRERAIEAGFTNYITKPLDPEKFLGQLVNLLVAVPELEALLQVVN